MTFPAIVFGIVLSSLYGTAFHFLKGGSLKKLLLDVILAWLGFWTGHILGGIVNWTFFGLGPLNTGAATLGSALFLIIGDWLSRVQVTRK